MEVREHQLFHNALPDNLLDEPLYPCHVLQHMLIRLTNLALYVDVRKEPFSDRKRFLVPFGILPQADRIFRALMRERNDPWVLSKRRG